MEIKDKLVYALENYNIIKLLEKASKIAESREVVFLCVGNSSIWFDSFGPMVASLLMATNLKMFIYGNIKANIKADNLEEYVNLIYKFHVDPYVIVIDSALSKTSRGLRVKEGATECGALSNSPCLVGDLSITFCMDREFIRSVENYDKLKKEVKRIGRFILFSFKENDYYKKCKNGIV